jgi:uncharacterized membrane protein
MAKIIRWCAILCFVALAPLMVFAVQQGVPECTFPTDFSCYVPDQIAGIGIVLLIVGLGLFVFAGWLDRD